MPTLDFYEFCNEIHVCLVRQNRLPRSLCRGLCGSIGKFLRSTFPWKTGDGTGQSAKPENSASLAFAHLRGRILRRMTALSKNDKTFLRLFKNFDIW